ncbi:exonuclease SbcCD subunit D [Listeria ivanovii]|uniref:Nuclease SbcCD subunit D n=2 Tax=Listeria ivanovii TaxID=1638 RepID=A0ABS1G4M4_LISIV|nr:exonuclease SbcCD subunit D [Listeria ivanovii]EFR96712.1 nuclease sbcCD subunit D [Listeria ivanovii FSL F6-596]AIS60054.1 DNA repair exonuclease [Listeria ivanovii subsp. londoniensis]AIS62879.1 DNA repair exonuclease [Listeria ivanovii subsp. londoniensis]MBC2256027.1 exonuclease SbcCD subunit D [Listeria ivanovii]MBK1961828.1 exonuclease SbcCD subunit D [Listeria ivanovii subsp. londoniensis]
MKFLHTADLHLGKIVSGVSMLTEQEFILAEITKIAQEEKVDALIVAGDLYDRAVPPADAVKVLNDILVKWNVELGIPIFAISGNHDSAERLSFGTQWYASSKLYMKGKCSADFEAIPFMDAEIWLVPYHEPAIIREAFKDHSIRSFEDAMQAVTKQIRAKWNPAKAQILVGHAFVSGGIPSDSERQLAIGNVDRVSTNCFDGFTYTALGHLHHPHAINHPTIFYSGSPLKYSFSEVNDKKSVRIVEIEGNSLVRVEERLLTPKHDMRIISGTLAELTENLVETPDDFFQVNLMDEGALIDPMGKLRQFYPNILHLERKKQQLKESQASFEEVMKKDDLELFDQFFEYANGTELTNEQKQKLTEVFELARKEEAE